MNEIESATDLKSDIQFKTLPHTTLTLTLCITELVALDDYCALFKERLSLI